MSELDDVAAQLVRLGVPSHAHDDDAPSPRCPPGEACISEEEAFAARITLPGGDREAHVDTMTAYGVLSALPDGAGLDAVWAELADIDRGA